MSLTNRLKKNLKHLGKWSRKNNVEAYRLYDRDIPEYPYIIDVYKDEVVIWLRLQEIDYTEARKHHLEELDTALTELGFPPKKRFEKKREPQKKDKKYKKEADKKAVRLI
jgi:23S rRNA (guanine2445-N2)-methyltransferase / 23S rRNA (guanine2069-N7)-methyltransferase